MAALPTVFDPVAIVQTGIDSVSTSLTGVAGPALAVGAGVMALGFGWKLVKKFTKG